MLIKRIADGIVARAPAKLNLFLEILAKRPDGYHELETLMVAVSLYDTLVFREEIGGDIQLECTEPRLSTGPDNLVCRAARLLQEQTGTKRGARIRLIKRIPTQAGLAGGSSDAAATLAGLNQLWRLGLPQDTLIALSGRLGSDVAFFFASPAAWCTGRGERVTPLVPGQRFWFVIVCPPFGLATADVYRNVQVPMLPRSGREVCEALSAGAVDALGRQLFNRLQPVAEALRPEIAALAAHLAALEPAGQLMSGSGSSLFALCRHRDEARRLASALGCGPDQGLRVFVVRSGS
jgi:4-diphosphocytidyl-2-C-methyl-D-erythritol kinase